MKKKIDAQRAIEIIAEKEGTSVSCVKNEMNAAMLAGLCNQDPKVRACWEKIPCKGEIPTPEELIIYCAAHAERGINPFSKI